MVLKILCLKVTLIKKSDKKNKINTKFYLKKAIEKYLKIYTQSKMSLNNEDCKKVSASKIL